MADAVAQQRYAGGYRPVAVKLKVKEAPAAYPEHNRVKHKAEGATERWVDVPSKHGGANRRR